MKRPTFLKIFWSNFLIILLVAVSVLIFSFWTIRSHYIDTLSSDLLNLAITLRDRVTPLLEEGQISELRDFVKGLGNSIHTRITIINPEGVVLADSEKDENLMGNHKNRPEIVQAFKGRSGKSLRYSTTTREKMLYIAIPVIKDTNTLGVLRLSLFLKGINALINQLMLRILLVFLVAIAFASLVAFISSKSLSRPIDELVSASHRIASGDFDSRVFLKERGELRELADSFNYMAEKINTLFSELSLQKEELSSIISSIQEGLLVLDKDGKVTHSNGNFRKMVQMQSVEGEYYWQILRLSGLTEAINSAKENKSNFVQEVEIGERYFLCSGTLLTPKEGIVLTFHDITEIQKLQKVKKDFVVNVSHELRTPLTAIKGYVETLDSEIDKKYRDYLETIQRHTDRLINIVNDLLVLAELEEGIPLQLEPVNLTEMLTNILRIFEVRAKEKNLDLHLEIDERIPTIKADPFKLEQVFVNLIDNAVKYTEKGKVEIKAVTKDRELIIEIKDTGIGIPKEHIGRIFERFYVVDKSRSRQFGGTGLGLSIVKHIVLMHNGKIEVESTLGKGSKFTISLPL